MLLGTSASSSCYQSREQPATSTTAILAENQSVKLVSDNPKGGSRIVGSALWIITPQAMVVCSHRRLNTSMSAAHNNDNYYRRLGLRASLITSVIFKYVKIKLNLLCNNNTVLSNLTIMLLFDF